MIACKDCMHFMPKSEKCNRSVKNDYINGVVDYFYARTERESKISDDCGHNAKYFELNVWSHLNLPK